MATEPEPKPNLSFREFLEKSTNLLTVFAVFNALTIFSASLPYKEFGTFLSAIFLLLSLLVCYEIVMFTVESKDESFKYELFYGLISFAQLLLIFYFVRTYATLIVLVSFFVIFYLYVHLLHKFTVNFFVDLFLAIVGKDKAKKNAKTFSLISFLLLSLVSIVLTIFTFKIILPFANRILPKDSIEIFKSPKKDSA